MAFYLVIRGPLGVGKSTVSERLARELPAGCLSIDRILEEHDLEEWEEDRISLRSFLRANEFAEERARRFLDADRPVVIEGNFYWKEQLEDLTRRLAYPHGVFTLKAPMRLCVERDRLRPATRPGAEPRAGDSLGAEAVAQVYRMVARVHSGIGIDATGTVEATVAAILRAARSQGLGKKGSR
jgi:predicted kinase